MRVVLDASAAISVALQLSNAGRLEAILKEADVVLAPDLFVAEVVNTVWKYHHFGHVPLDECDRALEAALGFLNSLISCKEIAAEAFLLARTARRPAYDMFYLALARREDAVLLTNDASLRKEAERQGIRTA